MSPNQPHASIDLWEFFAHVKLGRHREAYQLISEGQEPFLLPGVDDPEHEVWRSTFAEFHKAREETVVAIRAGSRRQRSTLNTRNRLLARSLVHGVGQPLAVRDARERLSALDVPWRLEDAAEQPRGSLPQFIAATLEQRGPTPTQAVVVGPVGAGRTLAAIYTYLRLTEGPDRSDSRAVLYVDTEAETAQREFGSEEWLERRLEEAGFAGEGRPIVILPRGDAFLSRQQDIRRALDTSLFRNHDVVICCGSQVYSRRLSYEAFGTHVIHLEPWDQELQREFALALTGERGHRQFVEWQQHDPSRTQLCSVPLHLLHVLALLGEQPEALPEISTAPQLLEGVARMRLRVARPPFDEDQLIEDLGSAAHRFYVDASPPERAIRFTTEELRQHLRSRKRKNLNRRTDAMINQTLIAASPGTTELRFEDVFWGQFFTARHIVHTVTYRPRETLVGFSRLLSVGTMALCVQMLRERLHRYRGEIHESLRLALRRESQARIPADRLTIAREQVGYLLGLLANRQVREELTPLVEPMSPHREGDTLVRRGLLVGLAAGGTPRFADLYVDTLRAERDSGGKTPECDANVGYLLSLAGDQDLDPERPERISAGADPTHLVADLVGSLGEPAYAGAWRIMAFTLVDLDRYDTIARVEFTNALLTYRKELRESLRSLRASKRMKRWPEVEELEELLTEHEAEGQQLPECVPSARAGGAHKSSTQR